MESCLKPVRRIVKSMGHTSTIRILIIVCIVVLLCITTGCTMFNSVKPGGFGSAGGGSGDGGTGGSYPAGGTQSQDYNPLKTPTSYETYNPHTTGFTNTVNKPYHIWVHYKFDDVIEWPPLTEEKKFYDNVGHLEDRITNSGERRTESHTDLTLDGFSDYNLGDDIGAYSLKGSNSFSNEDWGKSEMVDEHVQTGKTDKMGEEYIESFPRGCDYFHLHLVWQDVPEYPDEWKSVLVSPDYQKCNFLSTRSTKMWNNDEVHQIKSEGIAGHNSDDQSAICFKTKEKDSFDPNGVRSFEFYGKNYKIKCSSTKDEQLPINTQYPGGLSYAHLPLDAKVHKHLERTLEVIVTPKEELEPLKANPGGPYSIDRANLSFQLDGSKSTGSITEYRWTFKPGAGCPAAVSLDGAELKSMSPQVTLLCPVTATLTVTDGKDTDSASVTVTVVPRDWQTSFAMSADGIDQSPLAGRPWFDNPSGNGYEGGSNICGLCEGTANENTNLHPPPKGGSWEKSGGYEITQISEPDGPFDGYWYVSKYEMQINRKIVFNRYILPLTSGGRELPYNMGSFYQHNIDEGYPSVAKYLTGVRQHEQDHTDRIKATLQSVDPVKEIEQLFETNHDDVKTRADTKLQETEKTICQKSNDASQPPMRVTWSGKLLFPTSDTNQWKEGTTSVGGYRKDAGESCR